MSVARRPGSIAGLCKRLSIVEISTRQFHGTLSRRDMSNSDDKGKQNVDLDRMSGRQLQSKPESLQMTPMERAAAAAKKAREGLDAQQQKAAANINTGGLAPNSMFADDYAVEAEKKPGEEKKEKFILDTSERRHSNMEAALNPRPNARARWHRKMIIRQIHRHGRLTREMIIARTERSHLSRSHFFKTSMKKLAPLARQIAGKSVDQAILQMRFSNKRVAQEVREHLMQARDEAVVVKGMGLNSTSEETSAVVLDPSSTPASANETITKRLKDGRQPSETDVYIAQAWVNRGPYGREPEYRARGRMNILRPPSTGISVLLREEKTRTREKVEKEEKAIRKRMGKNLWTQLPDRPITNQHQHVLW